MSAWSSDELTRIGATEEVRLASARPDGTLRKPVVVWLVREGDDLYVRSVNGRGAAWFRGVQDRHEGRLWAGSVEKDVQFVDADHGLDDQIDAAYRTKYTPIAPSYVEPMVSRQARATTLKLVPHS